MVDSVYRTRSLGIGVSGIPDQYADGKAAKVWQHYIGGHKKRTESYREFFCNLLNDNGVKHILDVACGTGWENDPKFIAQIWQWTRHEIETHLKNVVFDNCVLLKMHIFTFLLTFINQQIVHKVICCGETFAHYSTLSSKPTSWIIIVPWGFHYHMTRQSR